MKKLLSFLCCFAAFAAFINPVRAEETYVYDETGTLSESELESLNAEAAEDSQSLQCGIYVVFTDDLHGYSESDFARGIYMNYHLGWGDDLSGVVLAVSADERYADAAAYGSASDTLDASDLDDLISDALEYLSDDDWSSAAETFILHAYDALESGGYQYTEHQYSDPAVSSSIADTSPEERKSLFYKDLPYAAIFAIAISLIINLIRKQKLKNIGTARNADHYLSPDGTHLDQKMNLYLGTTRSVVHMPRQQNRGSSGSGGYHSSGFTSSSGGHHF